MGWRLERTEVFDKALRDLSKRFPNAQDDILDEFKNGPPPQADPLPKYQRLLWKARAPCRDRNKGKRGGFRVIYYWNQVLPNVCLLGHCFFKGDMANLPHGEYVRLYASIKARLAAAEREADGQRPTEGPV